MVGRMLFLAKEERALRLVKFALAEQKDRIV